MKCETTQIILRMVGNNKLLPLSTKQKNMAKLQTSNYGRVKKRRDYDICKA